MDIFKGWASTLCVTVIFISIAHILLPNSIMKNHVKFALSLILLAVMVIPIVKFLTFGTMKESNDYKNDINVNNTESNKATEIYNNDLLIENLEKTLKKTLKNQYPKNDFNVFIKGIINFDALEINLEYVKVEVIDEKKIKKVEKIIISDEEEDKTNIQKEDKFLREIKTFISKELKINEEKIKIFYI